MQSLAESVKNGEIEEGSDAWYEAMATIDAITTAIDASTLSLAEYNNQLRQVKWDNFDYLQDQIRSVTSELDFMISELSREELTSEKTGGLTKEGEAVAYLHAASYEANKKQAEDYAKEIQKIEQALVKDPYHQDLLERKEALTKSYQDCIKAAQEEKEAVLDLQRQGYEALSNQIKNLTSEYGELLDAQKSAFDYQKNLSDKTKEIADIRKQLEAYSNDMSEEARAKMQSLTVSLEEAEKELQETQYEKYLSDTKEMLSELGETLEEAMQEVIRSLSENFEELIEDMEKNTKDAAHVITEKMEGIGYTPTEEFQTILNGSGITVAVSAMVKAVEEFNKNMQKAADQAAKDAEPKITKEETNEAKKNPKKEETDPVRKDNKQGKNDFPKKPTYQESTEKKPEKESAVLIEIEPTKKENHKKSTDKARGIKAKETSKKQPKDKNTTDKSRETAQISRKKDAKDKVTTDKARESIEKTTVKKAPKKKATTDKARESTEKITAQKDVNGKDMVDKSKKISEEIEGLIKIEEPQLLAKMEAFKVLHLPSTPSHISTPLFPFPVFAPKLEEHGTNVSIEVEHIVMNGVNDPEAFTANLTDAINNNRNVRNLLVNNTVGVMAKDYNSLSGRRFAR